MPGVLRVWILTMTAALAAVPVFVPVFAQEASATEPGNTIQMVSARGFLTKGIDAKKAKQGDAVTVKLDEAVKIPGSVELPRNSVLVGHVDAVQPSVNKGDSSLTLTFDKALLKNGQDIAIKATILRIEAPASVLGNQGNSESSPAITGSPATPSAGNAPGNSGGGMRSSPPAPAVTQGIPAGTPGQSQPTQQSIPGIELHSDIHESNSGVFTAKKKNVHLDGGIEMQFAIAFIPPGTEVK